MSCPELEKDVAASPEVAHCQTALPFYESQLRIAFVDVWLQVGTGWVPARRVGAIFLGTTCADRGLARHFAE